MTRLFYVDFGAGRKGVLAGCRTSDPFSSKSINRSCKNDGRLFQKYRVVSDTRDEKTMPMPMPMNHQTTERSDAEFLKNVNFGRTGITQHQPNAASTLLRRCHC